MTKRPTSSSHKASMVDGTRRAHEGKHEGKAVIQVREESTKTRFSRKVLLLRTPLFYLDQPHLWLSLDFKADPSLE